MKRDLLLRMPRTVVIVLLSLIGLWLATTTGLSQTDRAVVGEWSGRLEGPDWPPIAPAHMHVLPNGKVLAWAFGGDQVFVWDPVSYAFTPVANSTRNIFCAGHSFLPDGQLLVTGGLKRGTETVVDAENHTIGTSGCVTTRTRPTCPRATVLFCRAAMLPCFSIRFFILRELEMRHPATRRFRWRTSRTFASWAVPVQAIPSLAMRRASRRRPDPWGKELATASDLPWPRNGLAHDTIARVSSYLISMYSPSVAMATSWKASAAKQLRLRPT